MGREFFKPADRNHSSKMPVPIRVHLRSSAVKNPEQMAMPLTYQRGKRYWRQRQQTRFEFQEEFSDNVSPAPFPSPLLCRPGPGSWLVTDTDLRMTTNLSSLVYTGTSGNWDRCMLVSTLPFHRKAGQYIEFEVTPQNVAYHRAGWNNASAGTIQNNEATLYIGGGGFINVTDGLDVVSPLYPYAAATSYLCRIYDTGTGFLYYVKPTLAPANAWTLLWERSTSYTRLTALWPALNNHSLAGGMDFVRVRQGMLKPPLVVTARPPANYAVAGAADALLEAMVLAPRNDQRSLYFRVSDPNNYWRAVMDTSANTFSLRKVVAGVETVVGSMTVNWSTGSYYPLRVLTFAHHLRAFYGINPGPTADDAFNQTATLCGAGPLSGGGAVVDGDILNLRCQTGGALLLN
jgi:hypothetical protein